MTNMLALIEDWPEPRWKIGEPPIIPGDHVRCLRRVRPDREIISFMHIAKAGGSAFGADLRKAKLEAPRCGFISNGLTAPPSRRVQANADNMFRIIDRERRGGRGGEEEEEGWCDFVVSLSDVEFIFNSFISVDMYSIFFLNVSNDEFFKAN